MNGMAQSGRTTDLTRLPHSKLAEELLNPTSSKRPIASVSERSWTAKCLIWPEQREAELVESVNLIRLPANETRAMPKWSGKCCVADGIETSQGAEKGPQHEEIR